MFELLCGLAAATRGVTKMGLMVRAGQIVARLGPDLLVNVDARNVNWCGLQLWLA